MSEADLIITNARVFTADPNQPRAQAIALKGKRIVAVGKESEVLSLRGSATKMIDGRAKTLMPGIIDSHFHLYWGALNLANIQLEGIRGLDAIKHEVEAFKKAHPEKQILRGSSLGYDVLPHNERLTRQHLDQIEPDIPLILVAFDFHNAWANTAALNLAGILHGADTPSNSEVVMAEDGLASGELREFEAISLITDLMPKPSEAEELGLVKKAIGLANSYGITSLHNMNGDREEFALYQKLDQANDFPIRLYYPFRMYPDMPLSVIENEAVYLRESYRSPKLKAGALKLFMDGVIDSFTGFMLEPYVNNPATRGEGIYGEQQFKDIAVQADKQGLQITVHAIGDAAIRRTLNGYEAAQKANGKRDSRHRIEHIEFLHPDDLPRFKELGVIASMQPYHCSRPEKNYLLPYLDCLPKDRYQDSFPWEILRQSGAHLAFGSDWPVVSMNPFYGFAWAVNREPWLTGLPGQAQSLENTLLGYTRDAAYTEFAENEKGQLKEGMLADMVLLSEDVFELSSAELEHLSAVLTICDGEIVYEA
ncbi:MAG: amidohydrolase [Trueperaceae bacterium]|nr:amidohydrolase [Trueperaceae bacterium]